MARAKHRPAIEGKRLDAMKRRFDRAAKHEEMLKMHRTHKKKRTAGVA